MNECPIQLLQVKQIAESIKSQIESANLLSLAIGLAGNIAGELLEPLLNEAVSAVDFIYDTQSLVEKTLTDLINTISPTSWLLYAIDMNVKTVYEAAIQEKSLLKEILAISRQLRSMENGELGKYKQLSKHSQRIIDSLIRKLSRAYTSNDINYALSEVSSAERVSKSLLNLMLGKEAWTESDKQELRNLMIDAITGKDTDKKTKKIKEPLIDIEQFVEVGDDIMIHQVQYIINIANGLQRIIYVYSGISMSNRVHALQTEFDDYIASINVNHDTREQVHKRVQSTKDKLDKSWKEMNGKLLTGTLGFQSMTMHDKDDLNRGGMAGIAPYVDIPSTALTIYGAGARITTFLLFAKKLCSLLPDDQTKKYNEAMTTHIEQFKEKVYLELVSLNTDKDDGYYDFSNAWGKNNAAFNLAGHHNSIKRIKNTNQADIQSIQGNYEYYKKIISAITPIEIQQAEPQLGINIIMDFVIARAIAPFNNSRIYDKNLEVNVKSRISYLDSIIDALRYIPRYHNSNVENLLIDMDKLGLSDLTDALKSGQVVSNAISVSNAMVAGINLIDTLLDTCLKKLYQTNLTQIQKKKYTQIIYKFINDIKETKSKVINEVIDISLSMIGFSRGLLDQVLMMKQEIKKSQADLEELKSDVMPRLMSVKDVM